MLDALAELCFDDVAFTWYSYSWQTSARSGQLHQHGTGGVSDLELEGLRWLKASYHFLLHHDRVQLVVLQLAHVRRASSEFFLIDNHPLCYLPPNSTDTSSRFHMLLMHHVKLRSRCRTSKLNRHRYLHLSCRSNTTSSHHENRLESHLTAHQPQSSFQHPKYGDVVPRFSFPASPRFTSFIPVLAQTNIKPRYGIDLVREPPA